MKTTVDAAGRIVIPKEIRSRAGLTPGTVVNVELDDGRIQIEPEYMDVRLEWRGRLLVAVSNTSVEPITLEEIEATRHALLDERLTL